MVIIICGKHRAGLSLTGINFELAIKDLDHFFALSVLHVMTITLFYFRNLFKVDPFNQGKKRHFFMSLSKKLTFIGDFEIFV